MKIKIVKFTDDNGDTTFKLKKFFFGIPVPGYLWSDGETGACGETFNSYEDAIRMKNSFYWKKEIVEE